MGKNVKNYGNTEKRSGLSLIARIMMMALVPLVFVSLIIGLVSIQNMSTGMNRETMNGLKMQVYGLQASLDEIAEGDYTLDADGNLTKGDWNITEDQHFFDEYVADTEVSVTLFYGDTRYATSIKDETSGERLVGTKASDEVIEKVLNGGETLQSYNIKINDIPYYAFYAPVKSSDGTVVGMLFAGEPSQDVRSFVTAKVRNIVVAAVVMILIAAVCLMILANRMKKGVKAAETAVKALSNGDLTTQIDRSAMMRHDELGDMAKGVGILMHQLLDVVEGIQKSAQVLLDSGTELNETATETNLTADEISRAIEDISKGAVAQAEEIENASAHIEEMGELIQTIVEQVDQLNDRAGQMKTAGDQSVTIINELSDSNDRSMAAVSQIAQQVNATNDSASKIGSAVQLITSIAEETNLLSLNASIEAARAGEQGRGFAVVAGQIQKLAEQSNESAKTIGQIINDLLKDTEHTVEVMDEVKTIMDEQQDKLEETKRQFVQVEEGIDESREAIGIIKGQTDTCDAARVKVVDVISNLSAISEENAASTEETTASMEELNATISMMAEAAGRLKGLSEELDSDVSFFKL